ncbi:hypothetical protein F511_04622 [Dorcoceras hygrometricum]|uniref:Uncharacterized protein n=1 Tax=Dorcoceras hygrometricum TaxID=472368 RepID=A0A2Z7BRG9_9LAMI|nr:hypothetical protein F511_04622 [Dorcoceras hygrometricum]
MGDPQLLRKAVSDLTVEISKLSKNLEAIVELEEEVILVAECECCGLREECTKSYISRIRNAFSGKWVCGLCCEAVKETLTRRPIAIEEAMSSHRNFVQEFNTKSRLNPKLSLTWAMRDIVRRSRENQNKDLGIKKIPNSSADELLPRRGPRGRRASGIGEHVRIPTTNEHLSKGAGDVSGEASPMLKSAVYETEKAARELLEAELEEVKAWATREAERLKLEVKEEFLKSPEFDTLLGKKAGGFFKNASSAAWPNGGPMVIPKKNIQPPFLMCNRPSPRCLMKRRSRKRRMTRMKKREEEAGGFFKNGFFGCVAQWRANGYPEEEHPASFLNVQQAIAEMPDEEEVQEEEDDEDEEEGGDGSDATPPSSLPS